MPLRPSVHGSGSTFLITKKYALENSQRIFFLLYLTALGSGVLGFYGARNQGWQACVKNGPLSSIEGSVLLQWFAVCVGGIPILNSPVCGFCAISDSNIGK